MYRNALYHNQVFYNDLKIFISEFNVFIIFDKNDIYESCYIVSQCDTAIIRQWIFLWIQILNPHQKVEEDYIQTVGCLFQIHSISLKRRLYAYKKYQDAFFLNNTIFSTILMIHVQLLQKKRVRQVSLGSWFY